MACNTNSDYKLQMVNDMAVKTGTKQSFVCTADGQTQYTVYDYKYNITGDVNITYDSSNNLIVTLKNGFIQIAGSGTWPSQAPFAAPLYGSLSGPLPCWRSIAIAVSTSPDLPNSGWKKCLGGWYAAGTNCNTSCTKDKWGNPPGGTWVYFSDTQAGTAWEKTQYQRGGRKLETLTWNMGQIGSQNGQDLQLYMFARGEQACSYDQPACANMPWAASSIPRVTLTAPVCPLGKPTLNSIDQSQNICDNCVDVELVFDAEDFTGSGVLLEVDYRYEKDSWEFAKSVSVGTIEGTRTKVSLPCLQPEKTVCFRARYVTSSGQTMKSEYESTCFDTIFIPPVWMTVPPLTVPECTAMTQGKALDQFDHLTNYWGERL